MIRKLRGPMADWDLHAFLLRHIDALIAGGNWQRGGGKGHRPKPIPLPDGKGRGSSAPRSKMSGADIVQGLRNLGHIPAGVTE